MIGTPSLFDLEPSELRERLALSGEPPYRAEQVLRWAYERLAAGYDAMSDLPAGLRAALAAELLFGELPAIAEQRSADGSTRKALLRLNKGDTVETVLMEYDPTDAGRGRRTVCVSTQVGCAMGCVFCATGQQGFLRNLSAGEIVQQVLHFARELRSEGQRVSNVVFMGMGEPLANYAATLKALRLLTSPRAFGLGQRHVTISTVGLVPAMRRFAAERLQVGLAVSLHSPDDALRRRLVPTARFSVAEILAAADEFTERTGRRYTVEYALIQGVNDDVGLARELARRLRGRGCHVNLIPVNPTANVETRRSPRTRVLAFERTLLGAGVNATVRAEKGIDIAAGCGQLRGAEAGRHAAATAVRDDGEAQLAVTDSCG